MQPLALYAGTTGKQLDPIVNILRACRNLLCPPTRSGKCSVSTSGIWYLGHGMRIYAFILIPHIDECYSAC